jgi:PTH1 family peptidyl-tRNA hydrolase
MQIIIGLGNPGEKFNRTRHNAGFEALDFFASQNGFPEFEFSKKYNAEISEKDSILLAKPQTFMNESGQSVRELLKNKNEPLLIIIHDDIDLALGKMKFSKDSGAGGHKGVDSIIQHLGTKDFVRLKIGVKTDESLAEEVVLKKFTQEEQEILNPVIEKSAKALTYLIENGLEKTMNKFN